MMTTNITIRRLGPDELSEVWELIEQFHASVANFAGEMARPSKTKFFEYWQKTASRYVFVAMSSGEAVGLCLLQECNGEPYGGDRCLEVGALFVNDSRRREGIAKHLWQKVLDIAGQRSLSVVSEVSVDNELSRRIIRDYLRSTGLTDDLKQCIRPKPDDPDRLQVVLWMPQYGACSSSEGGPWDEDGGRKGSTEGEET